MDRVDDLHIGMPSGDSLDRAANAEEPFAEIFAAVPRHQYHPPREIYAWKRSLECLPRPLHRGADVKKGVNNRVARDEYRIG